MIHRLCVAIALLAVSIRTVDAIERKPLPEFPLVALDGTLAASNALALEGKWLLIYVQPECTPCTALLRAIGTEQQSGMVDRITIVVGGTDSATVAKMAVGYPNLAGSRWFADPTRELRKALPLAGAPVLFGLKGRMLEWGVTGLTPSLASVKNAMSSWVGRGRVPTRS